MEFVREKKNKHTERCTKNDVANAKQDTKVSPLKKYSTENGTISTLLAK